MSIVAGSATTNTVVDNCVTALNASEIPEFAEITWSRSSSSLVATADTAGVPFSVSITTTETGGGAADAQTIDGGATSTGTNSTASSGPYDINVAANWSGAALPTTGDDIICANTNSPMLYNLDALDAETFASFTVAETVGTNFRIGLPRNNTGTSGSGSVGYVEYRPTYFAAGITALNIAGGQGRLKFDTLAVQTTVNVTDAGPSAETGIPTVLWNGTNASNVLNVVKGSVGAGFFGDATTIATLNESYKSNQSGDATVVCGSACTLTTINKTGGNLTINSNVTTLTNNAGETIIAAGAPTTINAYGGQVRDRSTGTRTAVNVFGGAEYDGSQDLRAATVTTLTVYDGAIVKDPGKRLTFTNPIVVRGSLAKVTLDLGVNINLQRS